MTRQSVWPSTVSSGHLYGPVERGLLGAVELDPKQAVLPLPARGRRHRAPQGLQVPLPSRRGVAVICI